MPFEDEQLTADENEELETDDSSVDADADADTGDGDGDGDDNQDEYFLEVNERSKYRTREDAIKAYRNAGQRIAQLSPYEKVLKSFGVEKPEHLQAALSEYVTLREKLKQKGNSEAATDGGPTGTTSDADLNPAQKKALDWLKQNGVKAGYISKDALEPLAGKLKSLEERLDKLSASSEEQDEARFNTLVETGQAQIRELVGAEKFNFPSKTEQSEFIAFVEDAIRVWIEKDEDRTAAFYKGGEATRKLIEQGYKVVQARLNAIRANKAASYAGQKNNVVRRNPKLPNQSAPGARPAQKKPQDEDFTSDLHNKAFEVFQRASGRSEAE